MDCNSEDSEFSESEMEKIEEKVLAQLKADSSKVKNPNGTFRCPFCLGKKKQDYKYNELFQHATGIGASKKRGKERAPHLALATYMKTMLADEVGPSQPKNVVPKPPPTNKFHHKPLPTNSDEPNGEENLEPEKEELFVWPWTGVLVNVPTERKNGKQVGESGSKQRDQLSRFHVLKVTPLWNYQGHTGNAIVDFNKDWVGFKDALDFENYFKVERHGKKEWCNEGKEHDAGIYGWVARDYDYNSVGPVGDYLRKNGDLKSVNDLKEERENKSNTLVAHLSKTIDEKIQSFIELQGEYNATSLNLTWTMEQQEKMQLNYNEEMQKVLRLARENTRRFIEENQRLKMDLDTHRKELEMRRKQLDKQEAQDEAERKILDDEKKKNDHSLEMAMLEQQKVDDNISKLAEEHKREKEATHNRNLQLEKYMDAKQNLELEIEQLKGQLQVMKHLANGDDLMVQKKMEEMGEHLKEKMEDMEDLQSLNQTLVIKERLINDELQEARKVIIEGLKEILNTGTLIGIKRMGELDEKPFQMACKRKYATEEADVIAAELCSVWQEEIQKPNWHPFKIVAVDGQTQV
ncbi:hypothetical protein QJS10_CPA07g00183 [Acorus calamus]|uniref:XH/XS domain-containing protein n=1 Tax=Acorus calamus TaxID=4465 RepID=A0AAV9EF80_ACOCL|nr:hypothetical protein QJS10_CPA07g00183 [Acorus calamus]